MSKEASAAFRRITLLLQFFSFCVLCVPPLSLAGDSPWVVTPGVGHDQFEQTFFLSDTTAVDLDSLQRLERTIEDLKESYASLGLAFDRATFRIENTVFLTDAAWRDIAALRSRWRKNRFRIDALGRLEWKGDDQRDSLSSAYVYSTTSVTPRLYLDDRWSVFVRGDWEMTEYENRSTYVFDYQRMRGRIGAMYEGDFLEGLEAYYGFTSREVPDSSRLGYDEHLAQLSASYWTLGAVRLSGLAGLSDRRYAPGGESRDHRRWSGEAESRWDISSRWLANLRGEIEYWDYATEDAVSFDFHSGETQAVARFEVNANWRGGVEGWWRWEGAMRSEFATDDYDELALGPTVEWRPQELIWIEAGPRWGERTYDDRSLVYDDYRFWQIDVQGDATFARHLVASLSATYEAENHDDPSRDAEYFYMSFSLRAPLRL